MARTSGFGKQSGRRCNASLLTALVALDPGSRMHRTSVQKNKGAAVLRAAAPFQLRCPTRYPSYFLRRVWIFLSSFECSSFLVPLTAVFFAISFYLSFGFAPRATLKTWLAAAFQAELGRPRAILEFTSPVA